MKKGIKILLAILGGINTVFSMAIPILVALLVIIFINLTPFNLWVILICGILSSLYRAISIWIN